MLFMHRVRISLILLSDKPKQNRYLRSFSFYHDPGLTVLFALRTRSVRSYFSARNWCIQFFQLPVDGIQNIEFMSNSVVVYNKDLPVKIPSTLDPLIFVKLTNELRILLRNVVKHN